MAAQQGYCTAQLGLGKVISPHAADMALAAYRDEGRGLAAAATGIKTIKRALRGEPLWGGGGKPRRTAG